MISTVECSTVLSNLKMITNSAGKSASNLQVVNQKGLSSDKQQNILKVNGFAGRLFHSLFFREVHRKELRSIIHENVQVLSKLEKKFFINPKTNQMTDLFIAVQKYNQMVVNARAEPNSLPLMQELGLDPVENSHIPELKPLKISVIEKTPFNQKKHLEDQPFKSYKGLSKSLFVFRYNEKVSRINHSREAANIFLSTQFERILSGIGRIVERISSCFGKKTGMFQKYHYFRNNEDRSPEKLYSNDSPLGLSESPSSYWLGHATCLLNVPLKSKSDPSKKIIVNVITDPVEGDLNSILYPRQTKLPRTIEECPISHVYLLSHNHLDHFSYSTIRKLVLQQPVMIVPHGDGKWFTGMGFKKVIEMNWWEKTTIDFTQDESKYEMDIVGVPAHHWCGQGPLGGYQSKFLGYVIRGSEGGDVYFGGDTARLSQEHIDYLKDHFNIRWQFQPGGPDEIRKDMESTHQASADGLWMHFNLMVRKVYQNFKGSGSWDEFLKECKKLKTVYMHTKTFKQGNLHFDDTESSIEKVKSALKATKQELLENKTYNKLEQYKSLASYEKRVYEELLEIARDLKFDGQSLKPEEIVELIDETVIVPKIGSLTNL